MAARTGPSCYVDGFGIRIGLATTLGKLFPVKNTSEERETKVFMVDDAGHRVKQLYVCAENVCHPETGEVGWPSRELTKKGRKTDDGSVIVMTEEEIADAKGSKLEKNLLSVEPRPKADVDAQTWPAGSSYWFEPKSASDKLFAALVATITADTEHAYVGVANLRGDDKLFRVVAWNGGLIVEQLLRPQEMWSFAPAEKPEVTDAELSGLNMLVGALEQEWDTEDYASDRVANLRALFAAKAEGSGATITPITAAKPKENQDLLALLTASVATATATKKAKVAS